MAKSRFRVAFTFVFGLLLGATAASATPMPMHSGMMDSMMHMMSPPKSPADRAYMGAMMQTARCHEMIAYRALYEGLVSGR